jgi:hypothetical protein
MTIDYRDLLKRYIKYVGDEEGTDFIPRLIGLDDEALKVWAWDVHFTIEEVEELRSLLEYDTDDNGEIIVNIKNAVL